MVKSAADIVKCADDIVECAIDNVKYAADTVECAIDNVKYAADTVKCSVDIAHCTLGNVSRTLHMHDIALTYRPLNGKQGRSKQDKIQLIKAIYMTVY